MKTERLQGCKYGFNDELVSEHELYRNELVYQTAIMGKADFENVNFKFLTKRDPKSGDEAMNLEFSKVDFEKITSSQAADALIKLAAHRIIEQTKDKDEISHLSIKYQVLSDETAIVGVMKLNDKISGEM